MFIASLGLSGLLLRLHLCPACALGCRDSPTSSGGHCAARLRLLLCPACFLCQADLATRSSGHRAPFACRFGPFVHSDESRKCSIQSRQFPLYSIPLLLYLFHDSRHTRHWPIPPRFVDCGQDRNTIPLQGPKVCLGETTTTRKGSLIFQIVVRV